MRRVIPITEQYQHFVADLQGSFLGRLLWTSAAARNEAIENLPDLLSFFDTLHRTVVFLSPAVRAIINANLGRLAQTRHGMPGLRDRKFKYRFALWKVPDTSARDRLAGNTQ